MGCSGMHRPVGQRKRRKLCIACHAVHAVRAADSSHCVWVGEWPVANREAKGLQGRPFSQMATPFCAQCRHVP